MAATITVFLRINEALVLSRTCKSLMRVVEHAATFNREKLVIFDDSSFLGNSSYDVNCAQQRKAEERVKIFTKYLPNTRSLCFVCSEEQPLSYSNIIFSSELYDDRHPSFESISKGCLAKLFQLEIHIAPCEITSILFSKHYLRVHASSLREFSLYVDTVYETKDCEDLVCLNRLSHLTSFSLSARVYALPQRETVFFTLLQVCGALPLSQLRITLCEYQRLDIYDLCHIFVKFVSNVPAKLEYFDVQFLENCMFDNEAKLEMLTCEITQAAPPTFCAFQTWRTHFALCSHE